MAMKKLFEGFATVAKQAIGPELLRNLEAASWLGRVATCLDETGASLNQPPTVVAGKSGELACYLEQLDAEVKGSRFESQEDALRHRIEGVVQAIIGKSQTDASRTVAEAAGYFRAAANSVGPLPNMKSDQFNVTIT